MTARDPNREKVRIVAERLGALRDEVVFVGGAIAGLLITDAAASSIRATRDVDVIVEVATQLDYYERLRPSLLQHGFIEKPSEDAPICQWEINGIPVDVMPTDSTILGFTNPWYSPALQAPQSVDLDETTIRIISSPYYMATKLEAFRNRGQRDFQSSHDIEDLVAVVNGRPSMVSEIYDADDDVRGYLTLEVRALLGNREFEDALPGHLDGDMASQQRITIVLERLQKIADAI